jgi:hypothetical protein
MLTALALVTALTTNANASDVATTKKLGVGVATGPFAISATGKYYLSDKVGISAYLGTSGVYHGLRANFEMEFWPIHDWNFGRLDMYWDAGVDAGLWTYFGYTGAQVGLGGGVGAELQFEKVPASVFVDVGLGVYPLNLCSGYGAYAGFCLVSPRGAAGGRWYF